MKGGIYKIENIGSGRLYIGSSGNVRKRWKEHLSGLRNNRHENSYLQRSWNKYGEASFIFKQIASVEFAENLISVEQFFIDHFQSAKRAHGYNMNPRAESSLGRKLSEEAKRKIGERSRGNTHTRGKKRSDESKRLIAAAATGNKNWLGKKHSEDSKRKNAEAHIGRKHSDQAKQKVAAFHTGRKRSAETRLKMSLAQTGRLKTAECKEKLRLAQTGKKLSLEVREKMCVAQQLRRKEEMLHEDI